MHKADVELTPAQVDFLARNIAGYNPATWPAGITGNAGSDRRFVRIASKDGGRSYILILWDSRDRDWGRFIGIQGEVSAIVRFLPRIFATDAGNGLILEEDLGVMTLRMFCSQNAQRPDEIEKIYRRAIDALLEWQRMPAGAGSHLGSRAMDEEAFLWESDYFGLHCVAEYFGVGKLLDEGWQIERRELARELAGFPRVCIHRDFQSENIMVAGDDIRFVDFQGARLGPAGYDLASLLYDPYAEVLDIVGIERLMQYYRSKTPGFLNERAFNLCAVSRLMQALGAYGNLSLNKGKDWYRQFVPAALKNLATVAGNLKGLDTIKKIAAVCIKESKKTEGRGQGALPAA